jgi:hypothetical protein
LSNWPSSFVTNSLIIIWLPIDARNYDLITGFELPSVFAGKS